jgi:hypothetical protein
MKKTTAKTTAKTVQTATKAVKETAQQIVKKVRQVNLLNLKVMPKDGKGFDFLVALNRRIIPAQVTALAQSINRMGVIRPIVVANFTYLGKEGTYIIDGQHLYHALLRNNLDFPYVEITINSDADLVEVIALLNSSSKSWTLLDYIQAWTYIVPDYKILMSHFNTYDLEILQLASILHSNVVGAFPDSGKISKVIKNGTFNVINQPACIKLLDCITDVLKIIPRMDRMSNRTFVAAYVDYYNSKKDYDHVGFCAVLEKHAPQLKFVTIDKDTLADFLKRMN